MTSALGDILDSLSGIFARFADPSQRIFWPFLIASAAIALAVCAFRGRRLREVFSPSIWWHPSARMDYRLFFANAVIKGALWGAIMVSAVTVVF